MKKKLVWTVGRRLAISYMMMTLLMIASGLVGLNSTRMLSNSLDFVTNEAWQTADGAMEGTIHVQNQVIMTYLGMMEPGLKKELLPNILESEKKSKAAFKRMSEAGLLPEESILRLNYYLKEFEKSRDMTLNMDHSAGGMDHSSGGMDHSMGGMDHSSGGMDHSMADMGGMDMHGDLSQKVEDLLGYLEEMEATADGMVESESVNISFIERFAFISVFSMLVLGVLTAVLFYLSNSRKIVKPLHNAAAMMEDIAQGEGNLTVSLEVKGHDEIAQLSSGFNHFVAKLRDTMVGVTAATAQLATATEEMSSIAGESRAGINKQRNETDMVATSMNEMSATTQEVARNAAEASSSAAEANDHALNGEKVVELTIGAIERLANEVSNARGAISTLNEDSANIAGVLDVIKDIAEQTNLLALNAAIEAARAGEQGRGFAVVADEVRTLASRTRESTEEIEGMIGRLLEATKNAVSTMETGQSAAQDAVATSDTARRALHDITSSVDSIVGLNNQIATAAEQQGVMAEEVNRSITNITNIAVETDAGAEQSKSSTEEMARLASELQRLVHQFKV